LPARFFFLFLLRLTGKVGQQLGAGAFLAKRKRDGRQALDRVQTQLDIVRLELLYQHRDGIQ
jgi:hypothetical protein